MGWRESTQKAREAAKAAAETALNEKVDRVASAARDQFADVNFNALKDAAVSSVGLANGMGDVKKWRVAKAAATPTATAARLARGVGGELVRQRRDRDDGARSERSSDSVRNLDDATGSDVDGPEPKTSS